MCFRKLWLCQKCLTSTHTSRPWLAWSAVSLRHVPVLKASLNHLCSSKLWIPALWIKWDMSYTYSAKSCPVYQHCKFYLLVITILKKYSTVNKITCNLMQGLIASSVVTELGCWNFSFFLQSLSEETNVDSKIPKDILFLIFWYTILIYSHSYGYDILNNLAIIYLANFLFSGVFLW